MGTDSQPKPDDSAPILKSLLMNSSVAMLISYGESFSVEMVNRQFTEMFGYTIEDISDVSHWWERAYPDASYREEVRRHFNQNLLEFLNNQTPLPAYKAHITCKDGSVKFIEIHVNIHGDYSLVTFVDFTENEKTVMALSESESKYRLMMELAPDAFFHGDSQGRIIEMNHRAIEMTGYHKDELIGKSISTLFSAETLNQKPLNYDALKKGLTIVNEREMLRKDGSTILIEMLSKMMPDGTYQSFFRDITERKLTETALYNRINALTQPENAKEIEITDLFDIEELQKIQDTFAQSAHVASIITYPDGKPLTRPSNFCRLCNDIIRKTEKGLQNCFYSDSVIGRQNPDGPISQLCYSGGLWDAGASITIGGKHLANWLIGQVKNESVDEERMLDYAKEIGADVEDFHHALGEVPFMTSEQFKNTANILFLLANELSQKAYQNILQARFISERNEANKALEENEERLRTLINGMLDIVCFKDGEGRWLEANNADLELFGLAGVDYLGKKDNELAQYSPFYHDAFMTCEDSDEVAWKQGGLYRCEETIPTPDGIAFIFDIIKLPLYHPDGSRKGLIVLGRDITERKRAEQTILEMNRDLETRVKKALDEIRERDHIIMLQSRLASLGEMLGNIAHQWRQPLNTIGIIIQNFRIAFDQSMMTKEYLDSRIGLAMETLNYMSQTIDDFRNILKPNREKQSFYIGDTVRKTLKIVEASYKSLAIALEVIENRDMVVKGFSNEFSQALINILMNAKETFAERKISNPKVIIRIEPKDGQPNLTITDNAGGVDQGILHRIFEPYFTTKEYGTGIGLYMSKMIIEKSMGGVLSVRNIGDGAEFAIMLPHLD